MFPHTNSQIVINIYCVTFLQWVWIKPHSSGLTNVEHFTSNFCQFIQICCREKEKEENKGNCKAFSVTRKRKNTVNTKICFLVGNKYIKSCLTLLWWRPLSYRNQSIDLPSKSMGWFLYDNGVRHERVKARKKYHFLFRVFKEFQFKLLSRSEQKKKSFLDATNMSLKSCWNYRQ